MASDLERFLDGYRSDAIVRELTRRLEWPEQRVRAVLDEWLGEVPMGYDLVVRPNLRAGARVLEVGAGLGLLSTFL